VLQFWWCPKGVLLASVSCKEMDEEPNSDARSNGNGADRPTAKSLALKEDGGSIHDRPGSNNASYCPEKLPVK